jgi:hypothetical protein
MPHKIFLPEKIGAGLEISPICMHALSDKVFSTTPPLRLSGVNGNSWKI